MNPRHGEVWLADMGIAGRTRPVVVRLADGVPVERTLIIHVPVTRQARGGPLEIALGHLTLLDREPVANTQAIGVPPRVRFGKWLGLRPAADLARVKDVLSVACGI